MTPPQKPLPARIVAKFACALRGIAIAFRQDHSFAFHLPAATVVIGLAWWLEVSRTEWLLLALCITIVLAAEAMNTAIERLAKAVTREENPLVRDALDMAGGAVLIAAIGAAVVGAAVFLRYAFTSLS